MASETFQQHFDYVKDKPLRVTGLRIDGNLRTRDWVVEREFTAVLESQTLDELKDRLLEASGRLKDLDIFSYIDIECDAGPPGIPGSTELVVTLKEKQTTALSAGTFVQGGEGSVEATIKFRNLCGTADTYEIQVEKGSQQSSTYTISAVQPRLGGSDAEVEARVFKSEISHQKHSSYKEDFQGFSSHFRSGNHELCYELAMRQISPTLPRASKMIEKHRGPQLKSSLKHTFLFDNRDSVYRPTAGVALRMQTEVAGLGSPTANLLRFVRQELNAHVVIPLNYGLGITLAGSAGVVVPWGEGWSTQVTSISDRFFIGGPSSLRGFRTRGVGPSDARRQGKDADSKTAASSTKKPKKEIKRDYLGGDLKWTGFAALTWRLPNKYLQALDAQGQLFVDAGNVVALSGLGVDGMRKAANNVFNDFRVTTGVGITFPTRVGRIELNFCNVRQFREHDRVKQGFQFGIMPLGW
uniref:Bacterial surface antigen (D15) domain-containing protein n=1 Tax=Pyramimonas obovata TaxID=1411642 RepID=A0A7S0WW56_9CHLO